MQPGQVTAAGAAAPDRLPGEDVFLASIAGYVDTLGFVALFGLFTAHVTGNFILIGSARPGRARAADQMARVSGVHRRDRGRPPARPPDARARSWRAGRFAVRVAGDPARRLHVRGDRGVADRQRRRARDDRLRAARRGGDGRAERAWPADRALGGRQHGDDRQRHAGRHRCLRLARADRRAGRTGRRPRAAAAHAAAGGRLRARRGRRRDGVPVCRVLGARAAARGAGLSRIDPHAWPSCPPRAEHVSACRRAPPSRRTR